MNIANEAGKGSIWYGMHFYPGVAQYNPPGKESFRVFVNEQTIRKMDPTFAGRPVFVSHVDDVESNTDQLRKEADGWVVESFYNKADGKHWVKFIIVSQRGEEAIKQGLKLSNAYELRSSAGGGEWNGVEYEKQIMDAEFEHLALVKNPRYDESVVLSPEQFKKYNEDHLVELKRLSNSKESPKMKLNIFKRTKVENDLSDVAVELSSGRQMTITELVAAVEKIKNDEGYGSSGVPTLDPGGVASLGKAFGKNEEEDKKQPFAHPEHMVKLKDGTMCNVMELMEKHDKLKDELEAAKKKPEEAKEEPKKDDDDKKESKLAPEKKEDAAVEEEKAKNELEEIETRRNEIKARVDRLRSAPNRELARITNSGSEQKGVELIGDQVARGKQRYGSGK